MEINSVKGQWAAMWRLLALTFPQWVINRLTRQHAGKPFAIKVIPLIIVFLSIASITNLANRAYYHHADYSSYMTGAGIAVLVPIAVLAAMMIEGSWAYAFWIMSVVFATVSGTIQFEIYRDGYDAWAIAEAIAFGYGVPLSEVMLAIMEARLIIQYAEQQERVKELAEAQEKTEVERQQALTANDHQRELEVQRQAQEVQRQAQEAQRQVEIDAEAREFERQKHQIELEAHRAKLAQDAELEREKVLTELRIKEQKASAKLIQFDSKSDSVNQKVESPESIVLDFYRSNPLSSQRKASDSTGISQPKISRILNQLEASGVIHRNGNGVEVRQ